MADWTTPSAIHSKCGQTSTYYATKAIDTDTGTYWNHNVTELHWIIFDMGSTKTITKIKLFQVAGYRWGEASGLTVYVGDDPASLGAAVWDGVLNANGWQESGAFSKDGRYIKLVTKTPASYQRMYEFQALVETAIIKSWAGSLNVGHALSRPYRSMKSIPTLNATHTFTRPTRFMKLTQTANLTHIFLRHRFMRFTQALQALHTWTVTKPGLILKQWAATLQLSHTFKRPLRLMKFTQTLQAVHTLTLKRLFKFAQTLNPSHVFRRPQRKIGYTQTLRTAHIFSRPFRVITFPVSLQLTHLFSRPSRLITWLQTVGPIHEYYVIKPGVEPMKIMLLLGNIGINPKTGEIVFVL